MPKLLVVEDDATIAELLQIALQQEGFEVHVDPVGDLRRLDDTFDLVLLDLGLPDADGFELAERIRRAYDVPIIVVTARDALRDKVRGFDAGVDDYVTKPFSFEELSARIRAVLKRAGRGATRLEAGDLALDLEMRAVVYRGRPVELAPREFDLLAALMRRPGRVYRREELLDRVWGVGFEGESNVLEVTIRRLREKLGDRRHRLVVTVRGVGYTLRVP
jgi:DNA-binding response OmpR family regulator